MISYRLGLLATGLVLALFLLGLPPFLPSSKVDKSTSIFSTSIPEAQKNLEKSLECVPLRNVGFAESTEHYYASCDAETVAITATEE